MSEHTCKPCPVCRGECYLYVDAFGLTSPYQFEDTDESETCDWCEGTGRYGFCDRCVELSIAEDAA